MCAGKRIDLPSSPIWTGYQLRMKNAFKENLFFFSNQKDTQLKKSNEPAQAAKAKNNMTLVVGLPAPSPCSRAIDHNTSDNSAIETIKCNCFWD